MAYQPKILTRELLLQTWRNILATRELEKKYAEAFPRDELKKKKRRKKTLTA